MPPPPPKETVVYNPFVFRNLANAQYAQPRGSQYAGPVVSMQPTYVVTSDWDADDVALASYNEENPLVCPIHPTDPQREGFCGQCLDDHIAGVIHEED